MVHQDAHGLIKLTILIWVTSLLVMLIKLPTYLCPTYLPTLNLLMSYLPSYLFIYHLFTYLCPTLSYLPTIYLHMFYLPTYYYLLTYYLPT
jgi:hypothetical protein